MPYILNIIEYSGQGVADLDGSECEVKIRRVINGEHTILINYPIPLNDSARNKAPHLITDGCTVRIINVDNYSDWQTFYISKTEEIDNPDGTVSLVATGDSHRIEEMSKKIVAGIYDFQEETPENILGIISQYSIGTVEPTAPVSMLVSYESELSALQRLLKLCGGEYEIASGGIINVYNQLGSATKKIHILKGRNLKSLRRTRNTGAEINKIYGIGGGEPPVSIAGTRHVVSSKSTNVIYCTHSKLVCQDDIWNTSYKARFKTGADAGNAFVINDCFSLPDEDRIDLTGDISGVVAGDQFVIEDTAGNEINYVFATPLTTTKEGVYKNTEYRDILNHIVTADLSGTYGSGLCENWTKEGLPVVTENTDTDYITHGSKSQKIIVNSGENKGVSQTITSIADTMYRVVVWVYIVNGSVKIKVGDFVSDIKNATDHPGWQKFEFTGKASGSTIKVQILGDYIGTYSEFYFDSILVTEDRDEKLSFTLTHDLLHLWFETYDKIIERVGVQIKYTCSFVDLQKLLPLEYIYEEMTIGDTVLITDDELNISQVPARITEIIQYPFRPEHGEFKVESSEGQEL